MLRNCNAPDHMVCYHNSQLINHSHLVSRRYRSYAVDNASLNTQTVFVVYCSFHPSATSLLYRFNETARAAQSDYRLEDRGSIPGRSKVFFLWLLCPGQLWGTPSLLSNGYRGSFPRGKARLRRDTDHSPHVVSRSRMSTSYSILPLGACMAVARQLCFYFLQVINTEW
jgi:hypothetical protein